MALKEFKDLRQDNVEQRKRWFGDEGLEVFTWTSINDESIQRIEALWQDDAHKMLWSWQLGEEGRFFCVDEGDTDPRKNLSPTAKKEVHGDYNLLLARVEGSSGELPFEILTIFRMLA